MALSAVPTSVISKGCISTYSMRPASDSPDCFSRSIEADPRIRNHPVRFPLRRPLSMIPAVPERVREHGGSHREQPTCPHIAPKTVPARTAFPDRCCLPGPDKARPALRSDHGPGSSCLPDAGPDQGHRCLAVQCLSYPLFASSFNHAFTLKLIILICKYCFRVNRMFFPDPTVILSCRLSREIRQTARAQTALPQVSRAIRQRPAHRGFHGSGQQFPSRTDTACR